MNHPFKVSNNFKNGHQVYNANYIKSIPIQGTPQNNQTLIYDKNLKSFKFDSITQITNNWDYLFTYGNNMFPVNNINKLHLPTIQNYRGGILASNGKIYCIPHGSTSVLIIDTLNDTYDNTTITGISPNYYSSGVLAKNGKIYAAPSLRNNDKILVIDTNINTFYYISGVPTVVINQWWGGCLAPNGKIYFISQGNPRILVVDPISDTFTTIEHSVTNPGQWCGGVLAPNGLIYCIPFNSQYVAIIDPVNNTFNPTGINLASFGITGLGGNWASGVLGINGKIYCVPRTSNIVLIIDPNTNTVDYTSIVIDPERSDSVPKWFGGTLSPSGDIYMMPFNDKRLLIVNTNNNTFKTISDIGSGNSDWVGSVLAPSGKIYGIPNNVNDVLIIKTGIPTNPLWMISREFNKL